MGRRYVRVPRYEHMFEGNEFCLKCGLRYTHKQIDLGCTVSIDDYKLRVRTTMSNAIVGHLIHKIERKVDDGR